MLQKNEVFVKDLLNALAWASSLGRPALSRRVYLHWLPPRFRANVVFMNEVHISSVMETSKPLIQSALNDSEVVELWLSRQRSPLTRSVYRRDLQKLTPLDKTLSEVDPIDLERFAERLAGSGLAPISQGRTLAAVRSFFRFAPDECREAKPLRQRSSPKGGFEKRIRNLLINLPPRRAKSLLVPVL